MAKEIVTLNIEDTCLRLVVVKGKELRLAISQPLEAGLINNGAVVDPQKLGQAIKDTLQKHEVKSTRPMVAISGINAFCRLVPQPPVPHSMLAEAARREAERVMPVALSELHLSHYVLDRSKVESVMCLVGLSRVAGESTAKALKMAGLTPRVVDIKPLALARAVNEPDGILIDVQEATFDIVLMVDGLPQIVRSLPFSRPGLSLEEKATALAEESDRTVKFYNSCNKDRPIKGGMPMFVSGEIDGQGENRLSQLLGYGFNPLPQPPAPFDGIDTRRYLINVGLASKVMRWAHHDRGINLNVLPEAYFSKGRRTEQVVALSLVPLAVAAIVGVNMLVSRARDETRTFESRLAKTEEVVQTRQAQLAQFLDLEKKASAVDSIAESWEKVLGGLNKDRINVNERLGQAVVLAGPSIRVSAVDYSVTGSLTIKGTAPAKAEVLSYAQRLRDSGGFAETLVRSVDARPDQGTVEFDLDLKLDLK